MALAIPRPCYCHREDVKRALDIQETARNNIKVDRAIVTAADKIDGIMHRRFYIADETKYFDWPNFQRAYPWRIWFDQSELADVTVNPPTVTTGGSSIPDSAIFWGPWNYAPPYTFMELDRSQSYSYGVGDTPQRDVQVSGTFGYWRNTNTVGELAANVTSGASTVTLTDGSAVGTGDMLLLDSERLLVTNMLSADTGQALQSGCTTANSADATMTLLNGAAVNPDEILLVDSERMLVIDVTGNNVMVKRGWDGTTLATHTEGVEVYAYRQLAVTRGICGTAAASHTANITAYTLQIPGLIRDLALAEASVQVSLETTGYTDAMGAIASSLPDMWLEAETKYGRKARRRVI